MNTAEKIKDLRDYKGLRKIDVYRMLGIAAQTYSDYESGKCEVPSRCIKQLADFYGVTADYLLGRTDFPDPQDLLLAQVARDKSLGKLLNQILTLDEPARAEVSRHVELLLAENRMREQQEKQTGERRPV